MTTPALEDPSRFAELARFDWVVARSWRRLHALPYGPFTLEHHEDIACLGMISHPVRLACGRIAAMACIPGFGSRLCLPRCSGCCRAMGYVQGVGSPKNDNTLRELLGLSND